MSKFRAFVNELSIHGVDNTCFSSEIDDNVTIISQQFDDINGDEVPMQTSTDNHIDFSMNSMSNTTEGHSHEEELMTWHRRLSHMPMKRVQALATKAYYQVV
jgi:deoxyribodipyrimidine photolyase-like uncharacterized protein